MHFGSSSHLAKSTVWFILQIFGHEWPLFNLIRDSKLDSDLVKCYWTLINYNNCWTIVHCYIELFTTTGGCTASIAFCIMSLRSNHHSPLSFPCGGFFQAWKRFYRQLYAFQPNVNHNPQASDRERQREQRRAYVWVLGLSLVILRKRYTEKKLVL